MVSLCCSQINSFTQPGCVLRDKLSFCSYSGQNRSEFNQDSISVSLKILSCLRPMVARSRLLTTLVLFDKFEIENQTCIQQGLTSPGIWTSSRPFTLTETLKPFLFVWIHSVLEAMIYPPTKHHLGLKGLQY